MKETTKTNLKKAASVGAFALSIGTTFTPFGATVHVGRTIATGVAAAVAMNKMEKKNNKKDNK